jgi:predicted signal transduction protein with EAL and GGDEF domain
VTALSRALGMETTAEGVETVEQLRTLAQAGCSVVQGYLFSRPVPEAAVAELLRSVPSVAAMLHTDTVTAGDGQGGADRLPPTTASSGLTRNDPRR